ncbi:MAG: hypothetical protein P4L56_01370 [Candidatus Sulfopaludibacter sp.]|nr:hypothetical protein [Candidatus Sulfopaludibacter sp.]
MTRRQFLSFAAVPAVSRQPLRVALHIVTDAEVPWKPHQAEPFWRHIWPEAVSDFRHCGIAFDTSYTTARVQRPPWREPIVEGLERGAINLLLTNRVPMQWDQGRALCGVTLRYRGYHLCVIALDRAHGHQLPLLSVNTCTHELLHVLLLDIFEDGPAGLAGQAREFRIDWYATRLWLLHDGAAIRGMTRNYLDRVSRSGR